MDLQVVIQERDFTERAIAGQSTLLPKSYSFMAVGGPDRATISVGGGASAIWEAIEWLRCPVNIYDVRGTLAWWGYVHEVNINAGQVQVGVSLDSMANRLMVVFENLSTGWTSAGTRGATAWMDHAESVAAYGRKERRETATNMTVAAADYMRDLLAEFGFPTPLVSRGRASGTSAELQCRGWWHTLDWQYYSKATAASTVTTTQISDMVAAFNTGGSWLNATAQVDNASGVSTNEYRDGDQTYRTAIEALLKAGTSANQRLLAEVTSSRVVRVYLEPTASETEDLYMDADSRIWTVYGQEVEPYTCPVARWVRLRDVIPDTASLDRLAKPSPFLVERAEYRVADNSYWPESRGLPDAWKLGEVDQG